MWTIALHWVFFLIQKHCGCQLKHSLVDVKAWEKTYKCPVKMINQNENFRLRVKGISLMDAPARISIYRKQLRIIFRTHQNLDNNINFSLIRLSLRLLMPQNTDLIWDYVFWSSSYSKENNTYSFKASTILFCFGLEHIQPYLITVLG